MTQSPVLNRRFVIGAALGAVPALAPTMATAKPAAATAKVAPAAPQLTGPVVAASTLGLLPSVDADQTRRFQAAMDQAAQSGVTLALAAGTYNVDLLQLRAGTRLTGVPGATILRTSNITATAAPHLHLEHLIIDGNTAATTKAPAAGLLQITDCTDIRLENVTITNAPLSGVRLTRSSGRIHACRISAIGDIGIFSLDAEAATGSLAITSTAVSDCGNNGIQIWRSVRAHDGSRVSDSVITRIGNASGGSGQYGNGVNVFRAAGVSVSNCQISDCSYSAIRGNAADSLQMRGNQARRIGEVALYAEFGLEGAQISGNLIENAAAGIAVTNFNDGGRLAVIEGNIVRNLRRRENEPVDKRGEGIYVEADAAITGNVIEGAETVGLMIGWGKHLRDVVATGNLIRASYIGIAVSGAANAGPCLIANNLITGATNGAIRAMDHAKPLPGDLISAKPPQNITLAGNMAR